MNKANGVVPAVDRAVELLQALAVAKKPLLLAELSERTATSPSTAYNTLATLQKHGFVQKDERYKTYRLGLALFELGRAYIEQVSLLPAFEEIAEGLVALCSETVKLVVRDERDVIYLARVEGEHSIRLVARVGTRIPAHVTAVGKVLLAQLSTQELEVLYQDYDFPTRTVHSIKNFSELLERLQPVRQQDYAYDLEESNLGVYCVAAPIRDQTKDVIAAMSIGVPDNRLTPGRMDELMVLITQAARKLSRMLGWSEK
jgi:IclR family acetate operon transcriptional repressor